MKNKLLHSFWVLVSFYVFVSIFIWVFFLEDSSLLDVFFEKEGNPVNVVQSIIQPFYSWSLPIIGIIITSVGLGVFYYWIFATYRHKRTQSKLKGACFNKISSSIGVLPTPEWIVKNEQVDLQFDKSFNKIFSTFGDCYKKLFSEIVGTLNSYPDTDVGAGHHGTLLEHSIHVLLQAQQSDNKVIHDPLSFIAIAAHDVGKIISSDDSLQDRFWVRNGHHDEFSGMIVSTLPSFLSLPPRDRSLLMLLLKYGHKRNRTPLIQDPVEKERFNLIADLISGSDRTATKKEKEVLLSAMSIPDIFNKIFWNAVSNSKFMVKQTPPGSEVDGFRVEGNVIAIVEKKFREKLILEMSEVERAVFNNGKRQNGAISEVTVELISYLVAKELLIKEWKDLKTKSGLWNITSGTLALKGILLIELPEDKAEIIPPGKSKYPIEILSETRIFGDKNNSKKAKRKANEVKEESQPRQRNNKQEEVKDSDEGAKKSEQVQQVKKEQGNNSSNKAAGGQNRTIVRNDKQANKKFNTKEERKEHYKKPSEAQQKENKEREEVLASLDKKQKDIEENNKRRIKEASERLKDKSIHYSEVKAELDFLVSIKRIEESSPYYLATLSKFGSKEKKEKAVVKKEKNLNQASYMSLIKAGIG